MTTLVDAPARVDGVQLIGEMAGSGYRNPPALVRRPDGQVLQLTPLLYLVLNAADGRRSCAEIAELLTRGLGRRVAEADVRTLVDQHLRPLGLVRSADGSAAEPERTDPLLGLRLRIAVTDPSTTRRLTDPFRVLFAPVVVAVVLVAFVGVVGWVFFERGLGASAYDAFERPHLLLLVFVVSVLSGGFHEFGHAAAARYSGAQPGVMGAGIYLVWPAFYTDVTDSYRLGRAGRIRTDLGGLYFNAIVAVLTFVWWWATGWDALLLLVATQVLQMTQQLLPLLRFDGYHLLADLAGVPDLYQRIRPTLAGLLPHRWRSPENAVLKPWARAVITLWVLVTVPMMALMLVALVLAVPRLVGSAGRALREDASAMATAPGDGDLIDLAGHGVQLLGVVLPALACALVLGRVSHRFLRGLAGWSSGSARRRVVAAVVAAVAVTGVSWAWWPHPGAYRPIEPGERGRLTALLQAPAVGGAARPAVALDATSAESAAQERLAGGDPVVAAFPEDGRLPSEDDPALAMVLVPRDGEPDDSRPVDAEPWIFPFDQPLPPAEGDNQAVAVATRDGSVVYDVAFALVWADGNEVLNVNEAHAYASCTDCVAVAVAFQVVLVMDDAQVVVPQNLAVAANYDCYRCITAALASQLVLSLPGEPGEEELRALAAVWNELRQLAQSISAYSIEEIRDQLEEVKAEVLEIFGQAPLVETPTATPAPTARPGDVSVSEGASSGTPAPAPSTEGTAAPSPAPSAGATGPAPAPSTPAAPESPSASTTATQGSAPSPSASPSP